MFVSSSGLLADDYEKKKSAMQKAEEETNSALTKKKVCRSKMIVGNTLEEILQSRSLSSSYILISCSILYFFVIIRFP